MPRQKPVDAGEIRDLASSVVYVYDNEEVIDVHWQWFSREELRHGERETLGKHLSKSKAKARIGMASIVDDVYILTSPQHCVDQHDSSISSRRKGGVKPRATPRSEHSRPEIQLQHSKPMRGL